MAVSAVIANLAQFVGEDKQYQDTIYQADGSTAENITGWSVTFDMHAYDDPDNVYFTKTVGAGIVLTTPASGVLTITVDRADTVDLPPGQYAYTIYRTNSGANVVVTYGMFTLVGR